jgi:hypothetical protein
MSNSLSFERSEILIPILDVTAAGDMVVYSRHLTGGSLFIFEDETFAARAAIPPPKRSDSLSSLPVAQIEIL